jgi:NAD(P)-dependent dehydrogenase (short-subunit alcohol dehydrogenase family)
MKRLEGKVAIITGGAGGIGSATARRMVEEGARVVIADIDEQHAGEVAGEFGDAGFAVAFDAGDPASIEALVEKSVRHFGRLDILHNNAAITDPEIQKFDLTAPEIPLEIWKATLDVNLTSYLVACKYAIPHMVETGGGAIINTASGSGIFGDLSRIGYGTSKAGIIVMTKYIATQHGHQGIRCNAIAPGVIVTPALERTAADIKAIALRHNVVNRLGKPEDIAALAAFLASEESGYITGECIAINGGSNIHQPHYADFMEQAK